jgi:hypothetical protein
VTAEAATIELSSMPAAGIDPGADGRVRNPRPRTDPLHVLATSSAGVLTTQIRQLKRTGGKRGVAALCLGGGNAVAMVVEV